MQNVMIVGFNWSELPTKSASTLLDLKDSQHVITI